MKLSSARPRCGGRRRFPRFKLAICMIVSGLALISQFSVVANQQAADSTEFFEQKVRPILANNCHSCHNATARVAELDLTSADGFARGGESGPVIDRARLADSKLLKVISYHETLKMPPGGKLKDEEISALTEWVLKGAPWPANAAAATGVPTRKSDRELTEAEKRFWAFQPILEAQLPKVRNVRWAISPIDRFVLAKLEENGLAPAREADRLALIRRATFDLTGLPPTPREIDSFVADRSPRAFEKVVDRLLASPRYGEAWGRHWLDVARYADSTGNDEDHRYPNAWRYRDWVIEAFNRDLPYDQFVREQIAGDLLPSRTEASGGVNRSGIVATGFLALGAKALAQQDKTKMLYDVFDEQVDVTSRAFLGLTVACARCHDHKFDPILTRDYYSLVSIFASTRSFKDPNAFVSEPLNRPLVPKSVVEAYLAAKRAHDDRVKLNRYEIDAILDEAKVTATSQTAANLAGIMKGARRVYADSANLGAEAARAGVSPELLQRWVDYLKPGKPRQHLLAWYNATPEDLTTVALDYQERFCRRLSDWETRIEAWKKKFGAAIAGKKSPLPDRPSFEAGVDRFFAEVYFNKEGPLAVREEDEARLPVAAQDRLKVLRANRDEIKKAAPAEPEMACAVEDGEVISQKVFVRGDYHNPGEEVSKTFPRVLADRTKQPEVRSGSGRLELAQWITQPAHPLTARVMVNRIWGWHMGEALVRTPDNFGRMGERPTHPELLDYLARQFVRGGWSMKRMHREIMLSNTYRMASGVDATTLARDPENRLLSRFNRRRLTVEEVRDSLLALDGSLDLKMGGTLQSGTGTDGENDNKRLSLNPEKLNRRTVYLPLRRANLPALLNLFDFGDATTVNGRRQLTNVPTQALFWLNSDFLSERAANLARTLAQSKTEAAAQRVRRAYLLILGRRPSLQETADATKYLEGYRRKFAPARNETDAWASLARILMATNDFNYID